MYQRVKSVSFSKKIVYALNGGSPISFSNILKFEILSGIVIDILNRYMKDVENKSSLSKLLADC